MIPLIFHNCSLTCIDQRATPLVNIQNDLGPVRSIMYAVLSYRRPRAAIVTTSPSVNLRGSWEFARCSSCSLTSPRTCRTRGTLLQRYKGTGNDGNGFKICRFMSRLWDLIRGRSSGSSGSEKCPPGATLHGNAIWDDSLFPSPSSYTVLNKNFTKH